MKRELNKKLLGREINVMNVGNVRNVFECVVAFPSQKIFEMRIDFSKNVLIQKCISFSLAIIKYAEELEERKKFVIANQLIKSGTSIGASCMEAQSAESKADFIHKLKIADKEAYETFYWLTLCKESENYPFDNKLFLQLEEIMKLLNSIIHSSKNKQLSS